MKTADRPRDRLARMARWSRPPGSTALVLAVAAGLWACSAPRPAADEDPDPREARLEMEVDPPTAEIYIDGEYRGTVDRRREGSVPVGSGYHRLTLRADGYMARRLDVEVEADDVETIEVELMERLIEPAPDGGFTGRGGR